MMSTKIKLFNDRVFAGFTSFTLAVFATLDSIYPAATYISCGHIYYMYKDQGGLQAGGVTIPGTIKFLCETIRLSVHF